MDHKSNYTPLTVHNLIAEKHYTKKSNYYSYMQKIKGKRINVKTVEGEKIVGDLSSFDENTILVGNRIFFTKNLISIGGC